MKIKACLFDMDGVVADTESQYDIFLVSFIKEYGLPSDFPSRVKGVRWPEIINMYFSNSTEEQKNSVLDKVADFDANELKYIPIAGVIEFIKALKETKIKVALVTSSLKTKADIALQKMGLEHVFDTIITGDDIENGKPHPECYLLAAKKLNVEPHECIVLEDSFIGIDAGKRAEMKVIGVATTNSEDSLQGKVDKIIPDFKNITIDEILNEI